MKSSNMIAIIVNAIYSFLPEKNSGKGGKILL